MTYSSEMDVVFSQTQNTSKKVWTCKTSQLDRLYQITERDQQSKKKKEKQKFDKTSCKRKESQRLAAGFLIEIKQ